MSDELRDALLDRAYRVIYERGLEMRTTDAGELRLVSGNELIDPAGFEKLMGRPIIVMTIHEDGFVRRSTIPARGDGVLEGSVQSLTFRLPENHHSELLLRCLSMRFMFSAVPHHLAELAKAYSRIARQWERQVQSLPDGSVRLQRFTSSASEIYHSFEALLWANNRAINSTRHILWSLYGASHACPSNFSRVLDAAPNIPTALRAKIDHYWSSTGLRVKGLRDCAAHYVSVGREHPSASFETLRDGVIAVTASIPDNPETKSASAFTYSKNTDALSFGWEASTDTIQIGEAIIGEIE